VTPRSSGHKRPARFGGTSPPGTYRLCSSCAHRAPFRYGSEKTGSAETARATASPRTEMAPASGKALAHESNVAPVVITSSSSKIDKLSTRVPARQDKSATYSTEGAFGAREMFGIRARRKAPYDRSIRGASGAWVSWLGRKGRPGSSRFFAKARAVLGRWPHRGRLLTGSPMRQARGRIPQLWWPGIRFQGKCRQANGPPALL
jgi:hypothetical protein